MRIPLIQQIIRCINDQKQHEARDPQTTRKVDRQVIQGGCHGYGNGFIFSIKHTMQEYNDDTSKLWRPMPLTKVKLDFFAGVCNLADKK